jgi:hypothetical protein
VDLRFVGQGHRFESDGGLSFTCPAPANRFRLATHLGPPPDEPVSGWPGPRRTSTSETAPSSTRTPRPVPESRSRSRAFAKNGSYKGTATADTTINPDGTLTISNCTLKFTGGGGAYKGATGKGTCDGSADKDAYFTVNYKGNVKVPSSGVVTCGGGVPSGEGAAAC